MGELRSAEAATVRARWRVIALAALGGICCGRSEYLRTQLPDQFIDSISEGRVHAAPRLRPAPEPSVELRLPDTVTLFSMQFPADLAVQGEPLCRVAVVDRADRAIHIFRMNGEYLRTYWERGRPSPFASVASLEMDHAGNLIISYLLSPNIAVIDSAGQLSTTWATPMLVDSIDGGASLAAMADGWLVEHWLGVGFGTRSFRWTAPVLPLLRMFDYSGAQIGAAGHVRQYPGRALTAELNRGFVAMAEDTVWFARRMDGSLWAVPVNRPWPYELSAEPQEELPLFFRMRRPSNFLSRRTGRAVANVEYHLRSFDVTPDGRYFVFGQALEWPDPTDSTRLYRPVVALTIYDRTSNTVVTYDLGGDVRRVATGGGLVFVLSREPLEGREFRVRGWNLRMLTEPDAGSPADEDCHEGETHDDWPHSARLGW